MDDIKQVADEIAKRYTTEGASYGDRVYQLSYAIQQALRERAKTNGNAPRIYPTSCELHAEGYHTACAAVSHFLDSLNKTRRTAGAVTDEQQEKYARMVFDNCYCDGNSHKETCSLYSDEGCPDDCHFGDHDDIDHTMKQSLEPKW